LRNTVLLGEVKNYQALIEVKSGILRPVRIASQFI
jgi:hypothetical protein